MEILVAAGCLLAVALVALVVVVAVHGHRNEKRRLAAITGWAAAHRWRFVPSPAVDWHQRLPGRSHRGVAWSVFGAVAGRRVSVAEYHYTESSTTGSGSDATTHTTTHRYVVAVAHLDRPLGRLTVRHRDAFSRMGRALFGAEPVTGDREFDKRFVVEGDIALPPSFVPAHVAGVLPPWSLHGADVMVWTPGQVSDPATIPGYATAALHVADMLLGRR